MPSASLDMVANLVTVSARAVSAFFASSSINITRLLSAPTSSSAFLNSFSFSSKVAKTLVNLSLVSLTAPSNRAMVAYKESVSPLRDCIFFLMASILLFYLLHLVSASKVGSSLQVVANVEDVDDGG